MKRNRDTASLRSMARQILQLDLDRLARIYGDAVAAEVLQQILRTRLAHLRGS